MIPEFGMVTRVTRSFSTKTDLISYGKKIDLITPENQQLYFDVSE
jgi:hypothetical protein